MKKELQQEYESYVSKNQDPYGSACIKAGEAVMRLLDEGKTPAEAEDGMHGHDLTGFMAGAVAQAVVHFHERGEEFQAYWNKKFGSDSKEGVVNPAIVTIPD